MTPTARTSFSPGLIAALDSLPVATIIAVVLAIIGGVLVLVGSYSWPSYLDDMKVLIGLLAVGRGAATLGKKVVTPVR